MLLGIELGSGIGDSLDGLPIWIKLFDRIGAGRDREFVHETLDRKHIVVGAERPHR